jgi:hypothetical protein
MPRFLPLDLLAHVISQVSVFHVALMFHVHPTFASSLVLLAELKKRAKCEYSHISNRRSLLHRVKYVEMLSVARDKVMDSIVNSHDYKSTQHLIQSALCTDIAPVHLALCSTLINLSLIIPTTNEDTSLDVCHAFVRDLESNATFKNGRAANDEAAKEWYYQCFLVCSEICHFIMKRDKTEGAHLALRIAHLFHDAWFHALVDSMSGYQDIFVEVLSTIVLRSPAYCDIMQKITQSPTSSIFVALAKSDALQMLLYKHYRSVSGSFIETFGSRQAMFMLDFQQSEFYDKERFAYSGISLLNLADEYWTSNSKCTFSKSMLPAQHFAERLMDVAKVFVPQYITSRRYSRSLKHQTAYYQHHGAADKAEALPSQ